MNVLVIASHPDDEVLGCGGTIARHAARGDSVRILILGEGATARFSSENDIVSGATNELEKQARESAARLGVEEISFCGLPDNRFDSLDLLDVVKHIEAAVVGFAPEVVYTQSGGDLNIDHSVTFRATLTAVRPMQTCPVKELYSYEIPSSTEWAFGQIAPAFSGDYFVDVADFMEQKLSALEVYDGELHDFPHPRSSEGVETLAKVRGMSVGMLAAEAFFTIFRKV